MRRRKKVIFRIVLGIVIAAMAACGVLFYKEGGEYKEKYNELKATRDMKLRSVYVADKDIPAGSIIDRDDVVLKEEYTSFSEAVYMDAGMFGATALVTIRADSPILRDMVSSEQLSNDLKEYEISAVELMADQKEYDYIDIRIMFADGSDYLVLSKKKISGLNKETSTFYTHCTESEIHTMSSAIIDAGMYLGTRLYAVRYVESNIQGATVPNYPVRYEVIDLIMNNKNVKEYVDETVSVIFRDALEEKLKELDKR